MEIGVDSKILFLQVCIAVDGGGTSGAFVNGAACGIEDDFHILGECGNGGLVGLAGLIRIGRVIGVVGLIGIRCRSWRRCRCGCRSWRRRRVQLCLQRF